MANNVIEIINLSKSYEIYSKPMDMLKELITGKSRHDLFWALRNISFNVKEKHRVGIIGPNGAGKSTLLKLITGNLSPTSGSITVKGKISAMLTLASSLNPEEDGLRNIKFNLMMNGCNSREIPHLTEEIIDFTELGPFIYSPVKTYSSGMNARLAFAITTAMQPEILVVDEILSVGDGYFVGKAINRMIRLCDNGKALVFVSHSIADVRKLCDTVVWLENGSIRKTGSPEEICREYEEDYTKKRDQSERPGNRQKHTSVRFGANISSFDNRMVGRMRIVPAESEKEFTDVHHIRDIKLSIEDADEISVPLEIASMNEKTPACLDIVGSEWGRFYSRHDHDSRLLFANSGKSRGGCLLFMINPLLLQRQEIKVSCSFRMNSHAGTERLTVEYLDYRAAAWKRCHDISIVQDDNDWQCLQATCTMPLVNDEEFQRAREIIHKQALPDVQILGVTVTSKGEQVSVLQEHQPFSITVAIQANRIVPRSDVLLHIIRSDGVYVFWQSSGMEADNMVDILGEVTVSFLFNNNYFNAGEYLISILCGNGWDAQNNFPHSTIFDSKLHALKFIVMKEYNIPYMDFGQINMRVPVVYHYNQGSRS